MKVRELTQGHSCRFTVAVEGPDRVGKHTQAQLLASRLQEVGGYRRVGLIETPVKDTQTHARIYEMLRDGRALKHPATFQGLQVLNRVLYQSTGLVHWMHQFDAFVFDRWNASSYAYGRASGLSHDELMCELDLVADVDLTIVLDGMPFPKDDLDAYERDVKFQDRVRDGYVEWARRVSGQRVYFVDANDTRDAVHEAIWHVVQQFTTPDNVVDFKPHLDAKRFREQLERDRRGDGGGPEVG